MYRYRDASRKIVKLLVKVGYGKRLKEMLSCNNFIAATYEAY